MMSTLFGLTVLMTIIKAHNHQYIFLVDESHDMTKQDCIKQQKGINDYFKMVYDLQVNNVLSYITFNPFGNINKIINFQDEYYIPFDKILNKIDSISCINNSDIQNATNNNFNSLNHALKSSLSMYNMSDERAGRMLIFTHFNSYSHNHISIYNCYNQMVNIQNLLTNSIYNKLVISIVNVKTQDFDADFDRNVDNNFINSYYSKCLNKFNEYCVINPIFELKDVEYDTFAYNRHDIIYSLCDEPESTDNPTTTPTIPSTNPTISPSRNPTKTPSTNPTKSPTSNPTKSPSTNPTKSPSTNPTK
eukprot:345777_1